jgi:hypothetical protein
MSSADEKHSDLALEPQESPTVLPTTAAGWRTAAEAKRKALRAPLVASEMYPSAGCPSDVRPPSECNRLLLTTVTSCKRRCGHLAGHKCQHPMVLERMDRCVES